MFYKRNIPTTWTSLTFKSILGQKLYGLTLPKMLFSTLRSLHLFTVHFEEVLLPCLLFFPLFSFVFIAETGCHITKNEPQNKIMVWRNPVQLKWVLM